MSNRHYNFNGPEYAQMYKAYEACVERNNKFGLSGEALNAQYKRYGEEIQEFWQKKAIHKAEGREFGRMLAEERKALTEGLSGSGNSKALTVIDDVKLQITDKKPDYSRISVVKKGKVGTGSSGFKYYMFTDNQVFEVDKKTYNQVKRNGWVNLPESMRTPVADESKLPNKIKNALAKIRQKSAISLEQISLPDSKTTNQVPALIGVDNKEEAISKKLFGDKNTQNIADMIRNGSLKDGPLGNKTVYKQPIWSAEDDWALAQAKNSNSQIFKYTGHDGIERTMTPYGKDGKIIVNTADIEKIETYEKNRIKDYDELIKRRSTNPIDADDTRKLLPGKDGQKLLPPWNNPDAPKPPSPVPGKDGQKLLPPWNNPDAPKPPSPVPGKDGQKLLPPWNNPDAPKPPSPVPGEDGQKLLPPWNNPDAPKPPSPVPGKEPYCKKRFDRLELRLDGIQNKVDENGRKLDGLNEKMDDIAKNLDDKIDDLGKGLDSKIDDLGKNLGEQIGELGAKVDGRFNNVDDAIKNLSNKIDNLGKKLSQKNRKFAIIGGALVLAAGIIGYFIGKSKGDKVVQPIMTDKQDNGNDTITMDSIKGCFQPTLPIDTTQVVNDTTLLTPPISNGTINGQDNQEDKDVNSNKKINIDENGKYTTVWGDSFWNIAERVLEDKYANQPDKFKNLPKTEKDAMINEEKIRLLELNGYELDENGWFPVPILYPNDKIKINSPLADAA